jgi:hypothetical protein
LLVNNTIFSDWIKTLFSHVSNGPKVPLAKFRCKQTESALESNRSDVEFRAWCKNSVRLHGYFDDSCFVVNISINTRMEFREVACVRKRPLFWILLSSADVKQYSPLKINRRCGRTCRLHIMFRRKSQSRKQHESRWQIEAVIGHCYLFRRNVGWFSIDYKPLYPRR